MISSKLYKIFFITFLIIGGFLLLANANNALAAATCFCAMGTQYTAPDDAITQYGSPQLACEYYCAGGGGGVESVTVEPEAGPCGGDCPDGQICNVVTDSCEAIPETDACGGVCSSDQLCNEANGACESLGGACGGSCPEGQVCDLSTDTCVSVGATGGTGLPAGGSGLPGGGASSKGQANVQLPNFIGVTSISGLILKITDFLITLAIPFAVLMLIWAGFQFATAQGSPDKIEKAKKNLVWTVAGIAVILASQAIISYITEILGGTGSGAGSALITKIKGTLYQIIGLLFVLVTVYFFWGIVEFVRASGSGDAEKIKTGKQHMIWGLVGMAVMLGAWGIVEMIRVFFQ